MTKPFADMSYPELMSCADDIANQDREALIAFTYELITRYRILRVSFDEVCSELDQADRSQLSAWQNLSRA